jgi:H+-translocating NAD(P) transhydrogenase subunit alpha
MDGADCCITPLTLFQSTGVLMESTILLLAQTSSGSVIISLTIFALAIFLGVELITKIPPTLHTPLMSGTNAISGITIVGALLAAGGGAHGFARLLGFFAVVLATVNVVGGFLVTHRMLEKFKSR